MTAPDPAGAVLPADRQYRGRLRVVHEDEVVPFVERAGVLLRLSEVGRLLFFGKLAIGSLEAVVQRLGDLKEAFVTADDPPVRHPRATRR